MSENKQGGTVTLWIGHEKYMTSKCPDCGSQEIAEDENGWSVSPEKLVRKVTKDGSIHFRPMDEGRRKGEPDTVHDWWIHDIVLALGLDFGLEAGEGPIQVELQARRLEE